MTRQVARQLQGFQNESHAKSLASGIIRSCNDHSELSNKIEKANSVVSAVQARGVSPFFSAEYAKVFNEPESAMAAREKLMAEFEVNHGFSPNQAAKMADCVVFTAAKKQDEGAVECLSKLCSESLACGVPFLVVADALYYAPADVSATDFAKRCVATSLKQGRSMPISEVALTERLSALSQ